MKRLQLWCSLGVLVLALVALFGDPVAWAQQTLATIQPVSGTVAATQSGTWNITNVSGTVSLPTGAATSALQTTGNTALTTINTTLGTPFQAGGSIGNTVFNVKPQDAGGTAITDSTAHALKIFPVDPATGTALTVPSSGNGTSDSGTTRVAVISNNSAVAGFGVGATGSGVPANAVFHGAQGTSTLVGDVTCESTATYDASTSGRTQLVAISGSTTIYVCGYEIMVGGTATNVGLQRGTGSACGTGTASLTPAWQFAVNGGKVSPFPTHGYLFKTNSGDALCVNTSGANAVQAQVYYSQR